MSEIEMIPVSSSNIEAVGFDDSLEELHVRFLSGRHYVYSGVPRVVFDELHGADSVGRYFNLNIKNAGYGYREM